MKGRITLLTTLLLASMAQAAFKAEPLNEADARHWSQYLVPLPKGGDLTGRFAVPAGQLKIVTANDAEPLVKQAVKELAEAAGTSDTNPSGEVFTLKLQVGGAEAEELQSLPHSDQAYLIRPNEAGDGLLLVGGGTRGLYYAAKTMQQFLRSGRKGGTLHVPQVTIKDWPDMEDRGFWGGDSYNYLRWMSDRKLNYDEQIAHNGVDPGTKQPQIGLSAGKRKIIDEGPMYGINPVPVVLHLEQLSGSGLFEAYPELKGKDGRAGSICYSNPIFVDVLAKWLLLWRAEPGVTEVDVWMAENLQNEKGCQCDQCRKEDRSVLEARAIVAAWKKAQETQPDLGVRILTSEETENSNPKVFAELPKNMKIWYYHSLFTYNTSETPMIRPYLVDAINEGRWVGVCPNLCARVGLWQPFTGPQFVHYRMNEFVDKKLSGFIGYAVPRVAHVRLNAEAAAEWLWNAKGRSPREFAYSFAVRQGYADPEKFAEWTEAHGPVAWDVYGSDFPAGHLRGFPGKLADLLKTGKLPEFGEVLWEVYPLPWGDIKSAEQLDQDVKQAEKAVQLARDLGMPLYLHETLVTQGYIKGLSALAELKQLVKDGRVSDADKPAARAAFRRYGEGLEQARVALADWQKALGEDADGIKWVEAPRELLADMISQMNALASELGCAVK